MRFILIFTTIILYLLAVSPVMAFTDTSGDLQVTYDKPMFPDSVLWYPGYKFKGNLSVKNKSSLINSLYLSSENITETNAMAEILTLEIWENNVVIYGLGGSKTLRNFWDSNTIALGDIGGKETRNFEITVSMKPEAGNNFQGSTAKFDLIVGFFDSPSRLATTENGSVLGESKEPDNNSLFKNSLTKFMGFELSAFLIIAVFIIFKRRRKKSKINN